MLMRDKEVTGMKKCFGILMVTLATAILMVAPAAADSWNVGDQITYTLSNPVGTLSGSGGLFTITNSDTNAVTRSFCIELNEHIYQNDFVAGVSGTAVDGGRGGGSPDPISAATDWLFAQFSTGISSYQDTRALQIAFWLMEQEMTPEEATSWASTYSWGSALGTANSYIAAASGADGYYGTRVLNLADAAGKPHQSQLVHNPVPVPPAILLLGSGLIGLLTVRRRKIRP